VNLNTTKRLTERKNSPLTKLQLGQPTKEVHITQAQMARKFMSRLAGANSTIFTKKELGRIHLFLGFLAFEFPVICIKGFLYLGSLGGVCVSVS
jgi:hypothetical protein